MTLLKAIRNHC